MSLPKNEVVRVMRRSYLDSSGAELHVNVIVRKDRHQPVHEGMSSFFSDEVFVSLVLGIHSDTTVSKHGLWSGRRYLNSLLGALDLVLKMGDYAKLDLAVIARNIEQGSSFQLFIDNLQV